MSGWGDIDWVYCMSSIVVLMDSLLYRVQQRTAVLKRWIERYFGGSLKLMESDSGSWCGLILLLKKQIKFSLWRHKLQGRCTSLWSTPHMATYVTFCANVALVTADTKLLSTRFPIRVATTTLVSDVITWCSPARLVLIGHPPLTNKHLVSFAYQVARGMEYLSSKMVSFKRVFN